ncbi:MAG: hypothetical protein RIC35_24725 [Marinoscillum sp.]
MDIKQELETRVKSIEELIERKGIGSKQLNKARKTQRYLNITVLGVTVAAIVGIAAWLSASDE